MKRVIDTSEILGSVDYRGGQWEVCAAAEAGYDSERESLQVALDTFLRFPKAEKETTERPEWLPRPQTVTERASLEDVGELARDIFHSWVRKVRESTPRIHSPTF